MAVDRGGLIYPIEVIDQFSGPIAAFKAQLASLKQSLNDIKASAKGIGTVSSSAAKAQQVNAAGAAAPGNKKAQASAVAQLQQQAAAVNNLATAYQRLAIAKKAANIKVPTGLPTTQKAPTGGGGGRGLGGAAGLPGGQSPQNLSVLQSLLGKSQQLADRASFSFQRLFTVLATFAVVGALTTGFRDLITQMLDFNKSVESAELSIASLFLATGKIRDPLGNAVNSARAFALAQQEAARQTELLRKDAILTAATFEELLQTFQTGLAPGLQAGLNVDEIRKFTVQISQAAAAINLPQNQLGEEIRSLLAGTINSRNTRIATALGITNQDVKNAKEQGKLFEFLQVRFDAFTIAGQEALSTFSVLLNNVKEGLDLIVGTAGLDFFKGVKSILKEIQGLLITTDVAGRIVPNPQAVQVFQRIGEGLTFAVAEARRLGESLNFGSVLGTATAIRDTLIVAATVVSGLVIGFVKGVNDLQKVVSFVVNLLSNVTGVSLFDTDSLRNVVEVATRILTVVGAIIAASKLFIVILTPIAVIVNTIRVAFNGILAITRGLILAFQGLFSVITGLGAPALIIGALFILVGVATKKILDDITGLDLKLITIAKLIKNEILGTFIKIGVAVEGFADNIFTSLQTSFLSVTNLGISAFDAIINFAQRGFASLLDGLVSALELIPASALPQAVVDGLQSARDAVDQFKSNNTADDDQAKQDEAARRKEIQKNEAEFAKRKKAREAEIQNLDNSLQAEADKIIGDNENAPTLGDFVKTQFDAVKSQVESLLPIIPQDKDFFGLNSDKAVAEVLTFKKTVDGLPAVIDAATESSKNQSEALRSINEEAQKAFASLKAGSEVIGLTGKILEQRQIGFAAEEKVRESTKNIAIEEKNAQEELLNLRIKGQKIDNEVLSLDDQQLAVFSQTTESAKGILDLKNKLAVASTDLLVAQIDEKNATFKNDQAAVTEAQGRIDTLSQVKKQLQDVIGIQERFGQAGFDTLNPKDQKEVNTLLQESIINQGQQQAAIEKVNEVARNRLEIERAITREAVSKLVLSARQENFDLQRQNTIASIEANNARAVLDARNNLRGDQNLIAAENAERLAISQVTQAKRLRDIQLQQLQILIVQSKARETALNSDSFKEQDETKKLALQKQSNAEVVLQTELTTQLGLVKDQNKIKDDEEALAIEKVSETAQRARDQIERPVQSGIIDGLRQAAQELPTLYEGILNGIKSTVTAFADFVSTSIVDAFDPTKDLNIQERFARFLQDIAKQVLQLFVQLSIARAILGLGFLGGGGSILPIGGLGGILGFAKGGEVPGGAPARSSGIGRTDTIPAMLTPNEFVQPVSAVKKYGADLFERLRQGLVDPMSIRAIAGLGGATNGRVRAVKGRRGFATGGSVPSSAPVGGGSSSNSPVPAYVVANDQQVEKLLAGGKNAMFNFLATNKGRLRAIIGV